MRFPITYPSRKLAKSLRIRRNEICRNFTSLVSGKSTCHHKKRKLISESCTKTGVISINKKENYLPTKAPSPKAATSTGTKPDISSQSKVLLQSNNVDLLCDSFYLFSKASDLLILERSECFCDRKRKSLNHHHEFRSCNRILVFQYSPVVKYSKYKTEKNATTQVRRKPYLHLHDTRTDRTCTYFPFCSGRDRERKMIENRKWREK